MQRKVIIIFVWVVVGVQFVFGQGSIMLVGGGGEASSWSDEPYGWFVQRADSGIIINIDFSPPAPGYAGYFISLGADSSSHPLQIPDREVADDSATYDELISASGIFIEGGDQWNYIRTWQGTLVEDAITYVFNQGGAIGGTSAGLAVLGDVVFDAQVGTAYPAGVAYDPYNAAVTFTDDFLDILPNVFPDSHFLSRSRLGRLVPMLGRRIQDYGDDDLMGVGVEERTAFCIEPDLTATVYGRMVTIIYKTEDSQIVCEQGVPITFTHIRFHQLPHGAVFDLDQRVLVDPGDFLQENTAFPPGAPVFIDTVLMGNDEMTAELGQVVITGLNTAPTNWLFGLLEQEAGTGFVPYSVIIPRLWGEYAFFQNRWVGGEWGAATNPYFFVIYLDDNSVSTISSGVLTVGTLTYVLDTYHATYLGVNELNHPGIVNATLHFLSDADTLDLEDIFNPSAVPGRPVSQPNDFGLLSCYPNPFNSTAAITYELPSRQRVSISVYDVLGRQVGILVDGDVHAGRHQVMWDAGELPSGIYFVRMNVGEYRQTRKIMLLK